MKKKHPKVKVTYMTTHNKVVGACVDTVQIFICSNCRTIYNIGEPVRTAKFNLN